MLRDTASRQLGFALYGELQGHETRIATLNMLAGLFLRLVNVLVQCFMYERCSSAETRRQSSEQPTIRLWW